MSKKKLSKFNYTGCLKADFNLIVDHFDKIFHISPEAVTSLCNFLKEQNFENNLSYNFTYGKPTLKNATRNCALIEDLRKELDKIRKKQNYSVENLPFNYKNLHWLAHYIIRVVKSIEPKTRLTVERIKRFLPNSPQYAQAVNQFEKQLTQALVNSGMEEFQNAEILLTPRKSGVNEYEEIFRSKIIYAMDLLGADIHTAELTLEENAGSWRRQTMTRAFDEYLYPISQAPSDPMLKQQWHQLHDKHLAAYLRSKEAIYYDTYFSIINEAGTATDNMRIGCLGSAHASQDLIRYSQERNRLLKDNKLSLEHVSLLHNVEK